MHIKEPVKGAPCGGKPVGLGREEEKKHAGVGESVRSASAAVPWIRTGRRGGERDGGALCRGTLGGGGSGSTRGKGGSAYQGARKGAHPGTCLLRGGAHFGCVRCCSAPTLKLEFAIARYAGAC